MDDVKQKNRFYFNIIVKVFIIAFFVLFINQPVYAEGEIVNNAPVITQSDPVSVTMDEDEALLQFFF